MSEEVQSHGTWVWGGRGGCWRQPEVLAVVGDDLGLGRSSPGGDRATGPRGVRPARIYVLPGRGIRTTAAGESVRGDVSGVLAGDLLGVSLVKRGTLCGSVGGGAQGELHDG